MKKIKLTQSKHAIVSDTDFSMLKKFKWCAHREGKNWYAITNVEKREIIKIGKTQIRMHQLILKTIGIDHINGNGLDNRRSNLRKATSSQNNSNRKKSSGKSSKFNGVYWDSDRKKWVAQIKKNGTVLYLGSFKSERLASIIRDKASIRMFGKYGKLNHETIV